MKMLIAVDFSPVGREAAFNGYRYAQQLGADVTFLHIVPAMATPLEGYNMHFYITPEARSTEEKVKAAAAKEIIRKHARDFSGTLTDVECIKLTGLARNTYYKYKRELRGEG